MGRILVVDDVEMIRDSLEATLSRAGHEITCQATARAALGQLRQASYDLIVTDLKMPGMDGLVFLDELRRAGIDTPVVMMTAYATVSTAVDAMKKGAWDYIQKPFEADEITMLVDRALEHRRLATENEAYRTSVRDWQRGRELIGNSPAMRQVMEQVARIAQSAATVLIRGESGTGKEMIARALHAQSPRAEQPLLCVNCAALSSTLLESELFGHEKGAFTGADRVRKGRFELAHGGTLLLDEISEMDLKLQAKLLRVLQEREFERVGSSLTQRVDVRVIATTNRNLEDMVADGEFRGDLFYRLNVVPITLPPLRVRLAQDLEPLAEYFLRRCADRDGSNLKILSTAAINVLQTYDWPGNVRELENLMERISILDSAEVISGEAIRFALELGRPGASALLDKEAANSIETNRDVSLEEMERELIERTLERHNGHRQKTAQALGIGLRTLGMKIKRWNLQGTRA
jgi:DNA-binding NtrC family response regulator